MDHFSLLQHINYTDTKNVLFKSSCVNLTDKWHFHSGGQIDCPFGETNDIPNLGDKQVALFWGQKNWPFWVNSRDKQLTLLEKQMTALFRRTNNLPYLRNTLLAYQSNFGIKIINQFKSYIDGLHFIADNSWSHFIICSKKKMKQFSVMFQNYSH